MTETVNFKEIMTNKHGRYAHKKNNNFYISGLYHNKYNHADFMKTDFKRCYHTCFFNYRPIKNYYKCLFGTIFLLFSIFK